MFKPLKKVNENALKKDFFNSKKVDSKSYVYDTFNIKKVNHIEVNELKDILFPVENEITFVNCNKSRSLSDFLINKDVADLIVICSRINKKSFDIIKNKNLIGLGISERVLQNKPDLYEEIKSMFQIKLKNNHCKILAFKIKGDFIVIEGSGNPSINARNENYIIMNSEEKYNSIKNFFQNA